ELARAARHLGRDVEGVDGAGARRERPGQPPQPAAEVDDDVARAHRHAGGGEQAVEVRLAVGPEARDVRPPVLQAVVDEVPRVLAGARVPEASHVAPRPGHAGGVIARTLTPWSRSA